MKTQTLSVRAGIVLLQGCIELLLVFPLLLLAAVYILPESHRVMWVATLPIGYAVGYTLNSLVPFRRIYLQLLVSLLLGALHSYWLFGSSYVAIVAAAVGLVVVYRGIRLVWVPWSVFFPVNFYVFGMIVYFIASIVLHFVESFQPYITLLMWAGLAALVVTLLMSNENNMKQETLSGDKEPVIASDMMWKNRLLVVLLLIVIVLVVTIRKLGEAVLGGFRQLIQWLIALFSSPPPPVVTEPAKSPPPKPMVLPGNEEPAWWLVWLEMIMYFIVGGLIVLGCLLAIYLILRRLPRLMQRIVSWLARMLQTENKQKGKIGYEDDIESLMDWEAWNATLVSKWKQLFHRTGREKWEDLQDNQQRVRFLYRSWLRQSMRRGYVYKSFLTPKETGEEVQHWNSSKEPSADSLLSLYEQVRYGDKPIEDPDLQKIKQGIEKGK